MLGGGLMSLREGLKKMGNSLVFDQTLLTLPLMEIWSKL